MEILAVEPTILFVGTEERPLQVVHVRLRATEPIAADRPARMVIVGDRLEADGPVLVGGLAEGEVVTFEIGVAVDPAVALGTNLEAELGIEHGPESTRHPFHLIVAEPGWRMFMVSHFHYDPVWWNTQAAYTESWGDAYKFRAPFQEPGFALVKAHLEMARRDPDYKFVLAELDYLKPYWDVYPEDRPYIRQLLAEGRLELMGGTYNEPNTNLTSAETTIRNAIYGVAYQRDVLGGTPATAWQLDAFGHDPQFPGIMSDAGLTSSSWARGPFHEWGPNWRRGPAMLAPVWANLTEPPGMQFTSEFDWLSPSGKGVLTSFMANHYSAGWWMDAAPTLEQAEREVVLLFAELQAVAATKNVLLPVGTDYSPPNKWITAIHRDWNRRYVWPRIVCGTPSEFFAAVRAERSATGRGFTPQTRDKKPINTGKDVSFIDTKQAQRATENTLLTAEKFATFASLLGARYPAEAFDKAWRQLLFGAHHDGITGSESDQVYLDLLGGWREAMELSGAELDGALDHLGARIDTSGEGWAVTVFNPLSWPRTDVARAELVFDVGHVDAAAVAGVELRDEVARPVPFVVETADRRDDGSLARIVVAFVARDVPALGYRTYRVVRVEGLPAEAIWKRAPGSSSIENAFYALEVDATQGGAIVRLVERGSGKELLQPGGLANELLDYEEYQNHPLFGEGPWHLTPTGSKRSSAAAFAEVTVEKSPIGQRVRVSGSFADCRRRQDVYLWDGVDRVDFVTQLDDFHGQDHLFRIRFAADVEGGASISEVGNAVVGRGFAFPNADVAEQPFTLDNPAYNWFGLGATARVVLLGVDDGMTEVRGAAQPASRETTGPVRAARALSIAEVIAADNPAQDEVVRDLMIALVRSGVTATLGRDDGKRYGTLVVDSNMPDVRIVLGGPADNRLTAAILAAADPAYGAELDRQLAASGRARVWVPATRPLSEAWRGNADMRELGALPALIVAAADDVATVEAVKALVGDLDDRIITVRQPPELDGTTGQVEDYTVAVLNRGIPGFAVEPEGNLYLSLMRSCSGWPSGVWINPPRRTAPDGSNFQFQHWTHRFEYSLASGAGDWRRAEIVRIGHEYNNPLTTRVFEPHPGTLQPRHSFVRVEPSSAVLTVVKATGNPLAHMALGAVDPRQGITLRLYESSGQPTRARISSSFLALSDPHRTNLLEEAGDSPRGAEVDGEGAVSIGLDPFAIVTVAATPKPVGMAGGVDGVHPEAGPVSIGARAEVAQPVFADYWSHNKGPAPLGYLPVAVQIGPGRLVGPGPFTVPVTVASERTDGPAPGTVAILTPPGWRADPSERPFRLAEGAHLAFETTVAPAQDAAPGRYFVAAQIHDDAGQAYEDIVTIDYQPGSLVSAGAMAADSARSRELASATRRVMRRLGVTPEAAEASTADLAEAELPEPGNELVTELEVDDLRVIAGQRGEISVSLRNVAAGEIRGEAQLISPHETWPIISPWTQGFAVARGSEQTLTFAVHPPSDFPGGTYWALVKIMYFGRLTYTRAARIEVQPAASVALVEAAERPAVLSGPGTGSG